MKLTIDNFDERVVALFYKATQSGVQPCYLVNNSIYLYDNNAPARNGYIVDSLFQEISLQNKSTYSHLEQRGQGFFTTEEEAIEFHRELVLEYINNLNQTTLKSCPILSTAPKT
jgi:hypothetical protein